MDLTQISLSPMTTEDIPAVGRIERESQLEPWSENAFARELTLPHASILIARMSLSHIPDERMFHAGRYGFGGSAGNEEAEVIIGYICTWLVADELQVHNITVALPFRSHGIGRMLLEHVLCAACSGKAELAVLEVRKSNLPAVKLYERSGFVAVGERPNYYTVQPEPAILMEKKLS